MRPPTSGHQCIATGVSGADANVVRFRAYWARTALDAVNKEYDVSVDGNWNITMQSPMGAREVKADLKADGGALSGNFQGAQGSAPVTGTIEGDAVAFAATVQGPMGEMELKFDGTVDGDNMSGNVAFGAFGSGTWTAVKA